MDRNMTKRLYVGNLGFQVSANELETLFQAHGKVVSVDVVTDRDTGNSKGFAFVEMASEQDARSAVEALSGKPHSGRTLTVNEAKPRAARGKF